MVFFFPRPPPFLVLGGWTRTPIGVVVDVVSLALSQRPGIAVIVNYVINRGVAEVQPNADKRHRDNSIRED